MKIIYSITKEDLLNLFLSLVFLPVLTEILIFHITDFRIFALLSAIFI